MPDEPIQGPPEAGNRRSPRRERRGSVVGGITLVCLGVLLLLGKLMPEFSFEDYWPVLLIVIGAAMLLIKRTS